MRPIRPGFDSVRMPSSVMPRATARLAPAAIVSVDWDRPEYPIFGVFRLGPGWQQYRDRIAFAPGFSASVYQERAGAFGPTAEFLALFQTVVIRNPGPADRALELCLAIRSLTSTAVYLVPDFDAEADLALRLPPTVYFHDLVGELHPAAIEAAHRRIAAAMDAWRTWVSTRRVGAKIPGPQWASEFSDLGLQVWAELGDDVEAIKAGVDVAIARAIKVLVPAPEPRSGEDLRLQVVLERAERAGAAHLFEVAMVSGESEETAGWLYTSPGLRAI